jgi:hypothetical protein
VLETGRRLARCKTCRRNPYAKGVVRIRTRTVMRQARPGATLLAVMQELTKVTEAVALDA